jgi:hypothetical protein
MTKSQKTTTFILIIIAVFFANVIVLFFEKKENITISKWLTFFAPITFAYLIIFNKGKAQ